MEFESYSGRTDIQEELRKALKVAPWAIADLALVDRENKRIVMAVQGNSIDTGPLKATLEKAGFKFGATKITTLGSP